MRDLDGEVAGPAVDRGPRVGPSSPDSIDILAATHEQLSPVEPYRDFDAAASGVLQLLQKNLGLGLWMVTRKESDDWIVLTAEDRSYGVKAGDVFNWSDSFCSRMVEGLGPRIAPIAREVEAYNEAPIGSQIEIGAYVGVPLRAPDGSLFGTLCAIDPEPQSQDLEAWQGNVETYARLLATILGAELERQGELRKREHLEAKSTIDSVTGLYDGEAWKQLRDGEEQRCRRYGTPAGIVLIEVDSSSEDEGAASLEHRLRRTSAALQTAIRGSDVLARTGERVFAILAPDESAHALEQLEKRLIATLADAGVPCQVGGARRDPRENLRATQRHAEAMIFTRRHVAGGKDTD